MKKSKPMMKKQASPPDIVVTIGGDGFLAPALELAVDLALEQQTGLHGLFIEDLDLVHVASLPFTRETSLIGARSRTLDYQRLLRSLNASSRRFRQSLAQHAERVSLSWRYSHVRGRKRSMDFGEFAEAEFLIIGQPVDSREQKAESKTILLLGNHNPHLYQAIGTVLGKLPDQTVEVFLVSASDQSGSRLVNQLLAYPNVRLTQMSRDDLRNKLDIRSHTFDYVIAERNDQILLQQILPGAKCPVIVVS
jgi:hypothetical protein